MIGVDDDGSRVAVDGVQVLRFLEVLISAILKSFNLWVHGALEGGEGEEGEGGWVRE